MRALVYDEYTTDDDFSKILKIKNLPKPEPRSNEVVFKVISAALNYDDIWGMRGKPLAIPLPHISGTDAAGEVVAIGSDVKNIKVGDRVVSHGNMSAEFVNLVLLDENLIVKKERFGVLKPDLFGEAIVNLHICLKLMYLKSQKVCHMIKQQLHQ